MLACCLQYETFFALRFMRAAYKRKGDLLNES